MDAFHLQGHTHVYVQGPYGLLTHESLWGMYCAARVPTNPVLMSLYPFRTPLMSLILRW
uniref:Uncharacterized protein n=1 Tax=Anguilla anguilla TaxID=7936 RepID=A0A0E9PTQ5_ANGAN